MPAPPLIMSTQNPHPVGIAYGVVQELSDGVLAQTTLMQSLRSMFAVEVKLEPKPA